jgi:hypothetical protein
MAVVTLPTRTSSPSSGKPAARNNAIPPKKLTGKVEPRLFTPPLRPLNSKTSRGYEVAAFAEMIGEPLMPWQRWAAIHALETVPGGDFRFRTVVILVARQNGKSQLKRTISLWRLYVDGARTILGTAQELGLAREQWQMCIDTIQAHPDLAAELGQVRRVNGDEWFRLASGARYLIRASNRKAGRGLSIDELNIDELREQRNWDAWSALSKTTMARPRAQTWAMSNAGDEESVVLNQLRDAALSGRDPSIFLGEWSGEDGCELDDWNAIRQANPGLGHTISQAAIRSALGTDPPNVYRTEVLCQKVDHLDSAIDLSAWQACADPAGTLETHRGRLAACLDIAPDGAHVTLAVGARLPDGRVRGEIAAAWNTTDEARAELGPLLDRIQPAELGWYPSGPAAALAPVLRRRKGQRELKGAEVTEACQGLADLAVARGLVHNADPLLSAHIGAAQKLHSGDGWRFTRRGGGHVDAAYAFAGMVHIALTMAEPQRARIRMLG